jgi:hypothetical protein
MLLSNELLIEIMQQCDFKIGKDDLFGFTIEMSAYDAYDFSAVTGANYLYNENGITVKGRNEIFIHRSVFQDDAYIYSPGLFERDIEGNLKEGNNAEFLKRTFPFLFQGNKRIIFKKILQNDSSNIEGDIYKQLKIKGKSPENYILYKYYETGSGQESFYEYLATLYFIKKGYVVENQVPWFQQNYKYNGKILNGGIPDFSAFKTPILNILHKKGLLGQNNGILLNKIPVLNNFDIKPKKLTKYSNLKYELIIGEVKSDINSLDQAIKQTLKYSNVNLADKIYTIIPNCSNNNADEIGEIYLENNILKLRESRQPLPVDKDSRDKDSKWIENYIIISFLGNVSFNKLLQIIAEKYKIDSTKVKSYHLLEFAINTDINKILDII